LFHGANPEGSKQSSAIVLRRALLEAGFVVLAVDHPGYGASPAPSVDADIVAWDPLPTVLASLNTLRGLPNIDWIIAVGHSLGVTDILRLLHTKQDLRAVIVFGAALGDSTDSGDYWYKRFHTDRKMDKWIPLDRVLKIQERFYEDGRLLQDIYPQHPPIIFARFGLEWSKIAATRDAWYESIPGRKSLWDLNNSTHYFNSKKFMDLVVCDTRVTHSLATGLRHLASVSAEKVDGFTPSSR
jgi:pimeloyl-ACP methyl ester carboxylesterase